MELEIKVGSEVSVISKLHVRKTGQPVSGIVACEYPELIIHGEKMPGGTIDIPYHILQVKKNTAEPIPVVLVKINGIETEVPVTKELVKVLGLNIEVGPLPDADYPYTPPETVLTAKEYNEVDKAAEKAYKEKTAQENLNK